ncbi:peptidylprolyl isomerase [Pseudomonas sp. GX19020]|uniref:peptidylprolyl isomerase n=1 Tax=Pseudomonas sp. GX19020 TaxID=2942277 RepID=UPI002018827C|nr:peptidylprolyl isomerase [Pseudomonas sp. GX19020]MCL4067594.1 peptidylprolyl isomerase [Pseudomonas sp. GX19020]
MAIEKRLGAAVFWVAAAFAGLATGLANGPALAEGETAATVVATVNGTEITLGQMIALRESLPDQYLSLADDVLFNGILEQLIQQEALAQAHSQKSPRDKAVIINTERGYFSGLVISDVASAAVTDAALQKAWDEKYADYVPQKEYSAAHILVETEAEAKELKAELDGGADFAALAKEASNDPGSGEQGGELGWFTLNRMVKPFADGVAAATPGKVTDPVQSDFGWHLILVHESRDRPAPTLDEVRDVLAGEVEERAIAAKITELTGAATITKPGEGIDPALLKNNALID